MTEEERKSYEILYEKIIFVDKYRMLKPHWIKFHNYIEKLQKEIEEKTTIIMAGAEKVKQLEKEFITKQEIKENYIPKEKIREKIQKLENGEQCYYEFSTGDLVDLLKELLEEG